MATVVHWTCKRFDDLGVHALHDALALRCRVFILEQGPYQDPDVADKQAWHLLGYDAAGQLQACLRVVDPGAKFAEPSLGRVVTAPGLGFVPGGAPYLEDGIPHIEMLRPAEPALAKETP